MQREYDMKVREMFSIPLLKLKVEEDTDILHECEDYIMSKVQVDTPTQARFMNGPEKYRILEKYPDVRNTLMGYVRHAFHTMSYSCRFDISTSWLTINKKGEHVQLHDHKNSFWSAVYYYGEYDGEGGELDIINPLPNLTSFRPNMRNINKYTTPFTRVTPMKKDLIIFPSYLQHSVNPVRGDMPRKSLAFNIVPIDNYGDADSTYDTSWW